MNAKKLQELSAELEKQRVQLERIELKARPVKAKVDALEEIILLALQENKLEQIATKKLVLAIKRSEFAELFDDTAFFEYVRDTCEFDLVVKRCKSKPRANVGPRA